MAKGLGQPDDLRPHFEGARAATSLDAERTGNAVAQRLFGRAAVVPRDGRYELLEQRGAGGAGVVYAAYDRELDRRVAIKLVQLAHQDGEGAAARRARLIAEARAMARLSHPNVVAVHDVGTYDRDDATFGGLHPAIPDEGVFIVMELVEGMHLGHWVRARPREPGEVGAMFLAAGRGLAAVHAAGLVHRDFKPSNVLVRRDGHVLVADFGLARPPGGSVRASGAGTVVDGADDDSPCRTRAGTVLGTPLYMAPEQHAGLPADARSDQYAFCVALWHGLSGEPPFAGTSLRAMARDKQHRRVRSAKGVPDPWRETLLHGLDPDPAGRFESMDALLSVLAPPRRRSRTWLLVSVAGTLAAGALAAFVATGERDSRCAGLAERTRATWNDAVAHAVDAQLRGSGLPYATTSSVSVRARLGSHADRLLEILEHTCDGTVDVGLREARLSCVQRRLGELDAVVEVFARGDGVATETAVEVAGALTPVDRCTDARPFPTLPTARELGIQGELDRAEALHRGSRHQAALEVAASVAKRVDSPAVRSRAEMIRGRANAALGNQREGLAALRDAVLLAEHSGSPLLAAQALLALLPLTAEAQPGGGEAELVAGLCDARLAHAGTAGDDLRWELHYRLGIFRAQQDRLAEARGILERARTEAIVSVAAQDIQRSNIENALGVIAAKLGDLDGAKRHLELAIEIDAATRGESHPRVGEMLVNLGLTTRHLGDFAEARRVLERALDIADRVGPEGTNVASALAALATVELETGHSSLAIGLLQRAAEIQERLLGPQHATTGTTLANLASAQLEERLLSDARDTNARALGILRESLPPAHPTLARVRATRGEILLDQEDIAAAKPLLRRALRDLEAALGPDDPALAQPLRSLARVLAGRDQRGEAIASLHRALELAMDGPVPAVERARIEVALAELIADEDRSRAVELATHAAEIYAQLDWPGDERARTDRLARELRR